MLQKRILQGMLALAVGVLFVGLALHKSSDPWILGRYSLPYLLFLLTGTGGLALTAVLFYTFRGRIFKPALVMFNSLFFGVILFVLAGEALLRIQPAYRVLFLEPDRVIGWKMVPNFEWTWTGHAYLREYATDVRSNSLGFRGQDRSLNKPSGVVRVALLGDSMVEAIQVPWAKTAGGLLEHKLSQGAQGSTQYEVLNFGISNHGVGQNLLVWEEYASQFAPDYVFVFVAYFHMQRTVTGVLPGSFLRSQDEKLKVRPTFRLEEGELILEPPRDFERFAVLQDEVLETQFGGERSNRRKFHEMIGPGLLQAPWHGLMKVQRRFQHKPTPKTDPEVVEINVAILEELARRVTATGASLVLVDATLYFQDAFTGLSERLQRVCTEQNIGYVSLADSFEASNQEKVPTTWNQEMHFNDEGNAFFAEAMFKWLANNTTRF